MREVELLGRPGCHLCDDAREALRPLAAEMRFVVRERSIEDDDALLARYLERIPVVRVAGRDVSDHFVDPAALRAALASRAS